MSKKYVRVMELQHTMWRNQFRGVATMGPCSSGCGRPARGSGQCYDCAKRELGELVGQQIANAYGILIKSVRAAENDMERKVQDGEDVSYKTDE